MRYLVTVKSLLNGRMFEPGDEVELSRFVMPGANLTPTCDEGRALQTEYLASQQAAPNGSLAQREIGRLINAREPSAAEVTAMYREPTANDDAPEVTRTATPVRKGTR